MVRKSKEASEQPGLTEQADLTVSNLDDAEPAYQAASTANNHSRCGGALRAARENQGLSVQDVASRLR